MDLLIRPTGYWPPATGHRLPATGYRLPAPGHSNRLGLAEDCGSRAFAGEEHFLVQLVRDLGGERLGGIAVDDLGDLRRVMRRRRQALAGRGDLAKAARQLRLEPVAEGARLELVPEVGVIDVDHRVMNCSTSAGSAPYATSTSFPRVRTSASTFSRFRKSLYAVRNAAARSGDSHFVSTRTVGLQNASCATVTRSPVQPCDASAPTRNSQCHSPRCSTERTWETGRGGLSENEFVVRLPEKYSSGCMISRIERGGFA